MSLTPTQFITAARRKYNAVGNNFYADAEILDLLYEVEVEMAKFALTIEAVDSSTSTVAGTRSYSVPTRCIAIKRLTYNGQKLTPISFDDDDDLTYFDEDDTTQGTPYYYIHHNDTVYLRSIPDAVQTLKFYYYKAPTVITTSDTIETPARYHMDLVNGVVAEMMYKDMETSIGDRYRRKFESALSEARKFQHNKYKTDGLKSVKDVHTRVHNILGY